MNLFVLNCGSSSLKYKMFSFPSGEELFGGEVQRIGSKTAEQPRIIHRKLGSENTRFVDAMSYKDALREVIKLARDESGFPPDAIAHRLVQGGKDFPTSAVISRNDFSALDGIADLAPVHNPPVVALIKECDLLYPDIPQAIVLDTAFHSTIPDYAAAYAIPEKLRRELGIRKYGFHGISHEYVAEETARFLHIPSPELKAISCHLGSGGASLCAIVDGKSVDNSMGFSPLQGLVMSTRCGDLDQAVILKMLAYSEGDSGKVSNILNKRSGVLGLSGISGDIRDVINRALETEDERARRTLDVYIWRVRKYLSSYLAVVGLPQAVIFTDTIGESIPYVREAVCLGMEYFGLRIDEWKNRNILTYPADVSASGSRSRIVVVKTNEEKAIARKAYMLITGDLPQSNTSGNRKEFDEEINCAKS